MLDVSPASPFSSPFHPHSPTPLLLPTSHSVHDGWGLSTNESGNAVHHGTTTSMDTIRDTHHFVELEAHGLAVGLKEGLMGNSEVGHLNIGAGRIVWQDIVKIDQSQSSCSSGSIYRGFSNTDDSHFDFYCIFLIFPTQHLGLT
jgi:hypothetical protein